MTTHGRRRKRNIWPPTAALVLMFALAILLGALLNDRLDKLIPSGPTAAPTTAEEPLISDRFGDEVRKTIPTLAESLTNEQIAAEAQAVCDALSIAPLSDVYYSHELPVQKAEDAVEFFAVSVAWKCPEHMTELSELETP